MNLKAWIHKARELGASDLHVEAGTALVVRIRGELRPIGDAVPQTQLELLGKELLDPQAWARFTTRGSADISTAVAGVRCRISFYRTVRGIALAIRLLAPSVNDLRACNLHPDLHRLVEATTGLVVICGPTGSGKSTTLAALIEEINSSRSRHIITLESPLEYLFSNRRSYIRQREIPTHSPSFEQAIVDALRENPDVLVIGEMRTPEVMRLTLNAAETGHLVLATMHSATCAEALNRICMSFPAELQGNIRAQLADCLVGVLSQRLDFLESHHLLVPRCELLLASTAARGTIRGGQFSNIANVIQSGGEEGMWSFERYQRWMQQNRTWARPAAAPAAAPAPGAADDRAAATLAAAPAPAAAPVQDRTAPGEITIEEDMDLDELAELARQIEQRTE